MEVLRTGQEVDMKAVMIVALIAVFAAIGYTAHDPAVGSILLGVAVVGAAVGAWASRKKP
jgi:hypothetical protein